MISFEDMVVASAKSWLGTEWRHLGRNRFGVDCAGLVIEVGREIGACDAEFNTENYGRRPNSQEFLRTLDEHLDRIPKSDVDHGCVAAFTEPRFPCHIGIIERDASSQLWVIHAYMPMKKVVREPLVSPRLDNLFRVYRYRQRM